MRAVFTFIDFDKKTILIQGIVNNLDEENNLSKETIIKEVKQILLEKHYPNYICYTLAITIIDDCPNC